jgi:hypothetical protein
VAGALELRRGRPPNASRSQDRAAFGQRLSRRSRRPMR